MTLYTDALAADMFVGDVPSSVLVLPLQDSDGDSLDWIDSVTGSFVDPLGASTPVTVAVRKEAADVFLDVTWPSPSPATVAGLAWLNLVAHAAAPGPVVETIDPHPVIVETPGPWLTIAGARSLWDGGPDDPWQVFLYLGNARRACIEYAPEIAAGPIVPDYLLAQFMQARNTWEADRSGGTEALGTGEYAITRHPLDWQVKELLRPTATADRNVVT